jgi:hypothetical protein
MILIRNFSNLTLPYAEVVILQIMVGVVGCLGMMQKSNKQTYVLNISNNPLFKDLWIIKISWETCRARFVGGTGR